MTKAYRQARMSQGGALVDSGSSGGLILIPSDQSP